MIVAACTCTCMYVSQALPDAVWIALSSVVVSNAGIIM